MKSFFKFLLMLTIGIAQTFLAGWIFQEIYMLTIQPVFGLPELSYLICVMVVLGLRGIVWTLFGGKLFESSKESAKDLAEFITKAVSTSCTELAILGIIWLYQIILF